MYNQGNASAYRHIVSPKAMNFSTVPERIPLLICLATIGCPRKGEKSNDRWHEMQLAMSGETYGCMLKTNQTTHTCPFGNSASTEHTILHVFFPVLKIAY